MARGRPRTTIWNKRTSNPIISIRIPRELDEHCTAVRYEAGNIDRSTAIFRILSYLLRPGSIETTKAIIQDG